MTARSCQGRLTFPMRLAAIEEDDEDALEMVRARARVWDDVDDVELVRE